MKRGTAWRVALAAGGAAATAATLGGCGAPAIHTDPVPPPPRRLSSAAGEHTVVYRVTGHGTAAEIGYLADGRAERVTERDVRLPWSRSLRVPDGTGQYAVRLVVDLTGAAAGTHDDSITVDGAVLSRDTLSGTGDGHSDLSASFAG